LSRTVAYSVRTCRLHDCNCEVAMSNVGLKATKGATTLPGPRRRGSTRCTRKIQTSLALLARSSLSSHTSLSLLCLVELSVCLFLISLRRWRRRQQHRRRRQQHWRCRQQHRRQRALFSVFSDFSFSSVSCLALSVFLISYPAGRRWRRRQQHRRRRQQHRRHRQQHWRRRQQHRRHRQQHRRHRALFSGFSDFSFSFVSCPVLSLSICLSFL
jgi:hypothetical protein